MQRLRRAAAVVAVVYIAIQGFQEYVFHVLPEPSDPAAALGQSGAALQIARSSAMLLAMFGLLFFYGVLCVERARARPVAAAIGALGFLMFGFLEIGLRSVELFWTQLVLPAQYAAHPDPAILDKVAMFGSVQAALYFPLGLSTLIGSIALCAAYAPPPRRYGLIRAALVLHIVRIAARMATSYLGVPVFPSELYELLYFPMVIAFYGPVAYALWRSRDRPPAA